MHVVEERDARDRGNVLEPQAAADLEHPDIDLDVLRNAARKRLDVDLARDLLEDATLLDTGRLANELHGDRGLNRLIEPNLVEIDVRDEALDRVPLVVLEHRVVRGRLPVEDDINDRVKPRSAGQSGP